MLDRTLINLVSDRILTQDEINDILSNKPTDKYCINSSCYPVHILEKYNLKLCENDKYEFNKYENECKEKGVCEYKEKNEEKCKNCKEYYEKIKKDSEAHENKEKIKIKDRIEKFGINVDSYSIDHPEIPYNKNLYLRHDGHYLYYLLESGEIHWHSGD